EDVLRERAARRERDPARVSDADAEVALRLAREFEPLRGARVLRLTGAGPVADALPEVAAWLDGAA
ncbi:MAG TPA: hypothetical protein VHB30_08195, partial [Solirubrobacteraceae bacterium]|nr:hypothetical protein [Solirubrobacteraceae bacterium]